MATGIAELFVSVGADVTGAINGLNQLSAKLNATTSQFKQAAPAAALLAGAGAAVGAGFVGAVKQAANFEQAMANLQAVMSPSEAQQFGGALEELALSLGESTSFNAMQVAAGLQEMLKAGFSVEDVMGGAAASILTLAAATDTGVTESSTLAAQAMNAFGKTAKDLPGIVDTLAGVSVTTAADMGDMSQALSDAGVTAHSQGLSFLEFATSIGIFRQAGVSANASGTALKTMLTRLVPNTKAEVSAFKQLGIGVGQANGQFFDAQGNFKGMANASQVLQNALGGLNDEQRNTLIAAAFGTEAIQGVNALMVQGASGFNKYAAGIEQISATESAARRINTLFGALDALGGVIQSSAIRIGKLFTPELTRMAKIAQSLAKRFSELTPAQQRMVALFTAGAGAAAFLVGSFVLLAPAIVALGPAFGALAGILAGLSVPFLLLAGVAGLLVFAWRRDLGGIQEIAASAFTALPGLLDIVRTNVGKLATLWETRLMPALRPVGVFVQAKLVPAFLELVDPLKNVNVEVDKLSVQFDKANGFVREHGAQIALIGGAIAGAVAGFLAFQSAMSTINGVLFIGRAIITAFQVAFLLLTAVMAANPFLLAALAIGAIAGAIFVAYQTNEEFRASVDGLLANLGPLGDALGNAFSSLGSFVEEHGPAVLDFLQNLGGVALAELGRQGDSLQPFIASLGNFFGALGNFVSAVAEKAGPALQGFFQNVLVPGFEALGEALRPLLPLFQPLLDFIASLNLHLPTIGDVLTPLTLVFDTWAKVLDTVAIAIGKLPPLPDWLTPNSGANVFGNRPGVPAVGGGGPQLTNTAFGFGGGAGGGGGNVIISGPISINGGVELEQFAASIANAINGSARRVNPPPDNSGSPQLVLSFA